MKRLARLAIILGAVGTLVTGASAAVTAEPSAPTVVVPPRSTVFPACLAEDGGPYPCIFDDGDPTDGYVLVWRDDTAEDVERERNGG